MKNIKTTIAGLGAVAALVFPHLASEITALSVALLGLFSKDFNK